MAFRPVGHRFNDQFSAEVYPCVDASNIVMGQLVEISTITTLAANPGHVVGLTSASTTGASVRVCGIAAENRTGSATRSNIRVWTDPFIIFEADVVVGTETPRLLTASGGSGTTLIDSTIGTSLPDDYYTGCIIHPLSVATSGTVVFAGASLRVTDWTQAQDRWTFANAGTGQFASGDTFWLELSDTLRGCLVFELNAAGTSIDLDTTNSTRNCLVCVGTKQVSPRGDRLPLVSLRHDYGVNAIA